MTTTINRIVCPLAVLLLSASPSAAQVTVAPDPQYGATPLQERLLGRDYRDLWLAPVTVPVLDLQSFAGGLTPIRRGGGQQTVSLRLQGGDGREYSFRSVRKVPGLAEHPDLRGALLGRLIQDQASSMVPAASLAAAPLATAAGLLTAEPRLFVMPNDPALLEFRDEFAGMLGTLEEHPDEGEDDQPGFAGFRRIAGTERMLEHLEEDPSHWVDERAYLTARLLDIVIGDWDRHEDQWRWARTEGAAGTLWIPIPRDRDYAFSNYDGLLLNLARAAVPNAVRFRAELGRVDGLVLNAADLDRQLLAWLERPVWDSVATALQRRLSDQAIAAATRRLPPEHHALRGAELERKLRERRDALPEAARDYYLHLSRVAEIRTSDEAERAVVHRNPDGSVEVRIATLAEPGASPILRQRLFLPQETREIRIFLRGGDDRATVSGRAARGIVTRVIGGGGEDTLVDSSVVAGRGRWTSLHDAGDDDQVSGGPATIVDRRAYSAPEQPPLGLIRIRQPDHGTRTSVGPVLDYSTTGGVVLGAGLTRTRYAFRRHPYASRLRGELRYSPRWSAFALSGSGDFQARNPALSSAVHLEASALDAIRFYGFGNSLQPEVSESRVVVRRDVFAAGGEMRLALGERVSVSAGPALRISRPKQTAGTALDSIRPRGWAGWTGVGGVAGVQLNRTLPDTSGMRLLGRVEASAYRPVRSGERDLYGALRASAAALLPLEPAWIAGRGGWEAAWGGYPFHEAAYLGGRHTLRGFPEWRFAGDQMIHGTLETGVQLGRLPLVMNWRAGVFAFVDAGRVFTSGDRAGGWHSAPGAGLELKALDYTLRLTYARGPQGRVYLETRSLIP